MPRDVHDHFFREAKRQGYRSRAAFKLIEIDDRRKVLRPGDRVLDCGAAPGSWLQVASARAGPRGVVVGVDLKPVQAAGDNVETLVGDLRAIADETLRAAAGVTDAKAAPPFDVVLSDMAPDTTGDRSVDHHRSVRLCHLVVDRCPALLTRGGNLVVKVLEGEAYPELLDRVRRQFDSAKGFRPKASRRESTEMFVVAHGYRGPDRAPAPDPDSARDRPPPRRPSTGW